MIATLLLAATLAGVGPDPTAAPADAHPPVAYKILTRAEKETLETSGRFEGSAKDLEDGFVHLSSESQLKRTADLHFAGQSDLFVAAVDLRAAGASVKWELSPRSGQWFPHLYGVLEKSLVTGLEPLHRDGDGRVALSAALKAPVVAPPRPGEGAR